MRRRYLVGVAVVVFLLAASVWAVREHRHTTKTPATAGVECIDHGNNAIITFFYAPGTSQKRLNDIIASVHGSISERYLSLHGYSLSIADNQAQPAQTKLKSYPQVLSANISPSSECIDPD